AGAGVPPRRAAGGDHRAARGEAGGRRPMSARILALLAAACASAPQKPVEQRNIEQENKPPRLMEAPRPPPETPDAEFRQVAPAPGKPVVFHAPVPAQLHLANGL